MNNLITLMNKLPEELIILIKDYIPVTKIISVNKTNYSLYHYLLKKHIPKYENYIRDVIRRDCDFVFNNLLIENYNKWFEIKNYIYKNMIFKNYIYFVIHYCIENESSKCRSVIKDFLKEHGLCKNRHKKNIVKYIKWKK